MSFRHDVLSEVHLLSSGSPCGEAFISRFTVNLKPMFGSFNVELPLQSNNQPDDLKIHKEDTDVNYDEDGDICTFDKHDDDYDNKMVITLKHFHATPLSDVGKQLWKGSFVMADYISYDKSFINSYCIELGSGIGLCSLICGTKVAHVFATDLDEVLELCNENIDLNSFNISTYRYETLSSTSYKHNVSIRHLNWFDVDKDYLTCDGNLKRNEDMCLQKLNSKESNCLFCWSHSDLSLLHKTDIIFAADCVYDTDLTEKLLQAALLFLMMSDKQKIEIIFSIEKRLNFTIDELDVAAPSYEHFRNILSQLGETFGGFGHFSIVQIPLSFPNYLDYERTKYLELWKVECLKSYMNINE